MTVAPPDNEVLWARALVKSYEGSPALDGVSLGVRDGEIVAVMGPRGCGKSTLLDCLSGQLVPDEGEVWFGDTPVHTLSRAARERLRREHFGWIGSEPGLMPELTAWENVALPLLLNGTPYRAARTAAEEWMERLDVADCARKRPAKLLQSQRQRIAIARALVAGPKVIFADEPTAPLHRMDAGQVLRALTAAGRSHHITIIMATGDDETASYADRGITLVDGRCIDDSAPTLTTAPMVSSTPAGGRPADTEPAEPAAEPATEPAAAESVAGVAHTVTSASGGRSQSRTHPASSPRAGRRPAGASPVAGRTTFGTAVAAVLEGANRCSASA